MENYKVKLKVMMVIVAFGYSVVGCSQSGGSKLEGTFVNDATSEFSIAHDTLVVKEREEGTFLVNRSTGIVLIDENGKMGKQILEKEHWKASYNAETGELTTAGKPKITAIENGIKLERAVYRRVH